MLVKIYPDPRKAKEEKDNIKLFKPYLDPVHYPEYDELRRSRGTAYFLMVTNLVEGPSGESQTFKDMILSSNFTREQISDFVKNLISVLNKLPRLQPSKPLDLMAEYISKYLDDTAKHSVIDSYNKIHKWFGHIADGLSLSEKILNSLPRAAFEGTVSGTCHGDFHSKNIMIRVVGGELVAFLIDYSRSGGSHSIKDLVTLETDMVIRGLSGIKQFSRKEIVMKYLRSFHSAALDIVDMTAMERLQVEKVSMVIKILRASAAADHKVKEIEYCGAALLKTLEVLSYGKLPYDHNKRATTYVDYLIERIKFLGK